MTRLPSTRIERAAAARVASARDRLADRLNEALPGASVAAAADGVAVTGRGIGRDRLVEPALRWPAGLLR